MMKTIDKISQTAASAWISWMWKITLVKVKASIISTFEVLIIFNDEVGMDKKGCIEKSFDKKVQKLRST